SICEHLQQLRLVFYVLRKEQLYANLKKCCFCMKRLVFLGFIINGNGIEVDEEKVTAIRDWPRLSNASEVRSFHMLASFYCRFVPNFSSIASPLNELVKNIVYFIWHDEHEFHLTY